MKILRQNTLLITIILLATACSSGGGGSDTANSTDSGTSTPGNNGSPNPSSGNTSSPDPYVGTWKGTTYAGNGTFPDIILTLNKDGSYTCSGYPQYVPGVVDTTWTPWRGICSISSDSTATWDLPSRKHLRFTHHHSTLPGIGITKIMSSDATSFILELPPSSNGATKTFAQFNKQ